MTLEERMGAKVEPLTLLFLAGLIWLVVGVSLIIKGGQILSWQPVWLAAALAIGTLKAVFILNKIARRNVQRLRSMTEAIFCGRIFVVRTWIIIAVMIILGRILRLPGMDPHLSGFFSLAVGWGLVMASRLLLQGWLAGRKA